MKKYFLFLSCLLGMIHDICTAQAGLPSVADVFGNMSEDEITRQVQMGQQFLADLEKYGTPEEKAEFEKILLETLNSMSEQDFQDIQNIAKMVEPHLEPIAQPTPQPAPSVTKPEEVAPKTSGDSVEKIKNLIAAIINRIDEIVQKIESSKECKEEFDTRWSNRATFSSLKRQIAQLKNNRLAEKLSKSDLSEDDKKLVDTLESFLTELTEKNNKLVIEDTFGLTDSKDLEKKYLKQTKDIIAMFDNFIDSLTPKLEKFLTKWDPEALQLAKEASQKTDKAQEDANSALKRVPSADARSSQQDRSGSARPSFRDYESYPNMYNPYDYSPDMYSQYPGYQETGPEGFSDSVASDKSGKVSNASAGSGSTPTSNKNSSEIDQKLKPEDKGKANTFEDVIDSIESHFEQYTDTQANKNINFFNDVIANDYKKLIPALDAKVRTWGTTEDGDKAQGTHPNIQGVSEWTFHSFIPYTESVSKALETEYQDLTNELDSAKRVCSKVENSAKDFSEEEIKKVSNKVNALEQRFNSYQSSYNDAMTTIQDTFKKNFALITDRVIVGDPVEEHSKMPLQVQQIQDKFVAKLKDTIGDKITNVIANIKTLKSNIDRKSKRKSKSSKSSSLIMNTNV